ncbi:putative RNA-directed DNA polymerase [Helianthus annuus]|uniref:RNA-directed DNA polymerase n=1 Tax=Helianthus annuus TaxID=4232 RepID=A0A9K3H644_HELAN|nr:putative RNA-directed DNA polymerase [Helianthus annuus]KAJ0838854.1 putative RNA-directed DNA polymerase [Helianthus annuus]
MAGDNSNKENLKTDATGPDHNSPFYLHPSDYPRQMHVNDALTDNNYLDWVQEMENFLFAKNKRGFIDGTIKKPETDDINYMAWMRCDAMIKGWLTTAMEKEIRGSVKYANSASEIWKDLQERFGKESAPRAYELKQAISNTRQDGMTVSAYYTKLRGLWDEMQSFLPTPKCKCNGCTCGLGKSLKELREKEQLYEFLMGLDREFSIIRTQILATKPIPSLGNAYHLVAEDEQQRTIAGGKRLVNETVAFQATVKRNAPPTRTGQKDEKPSGHCDHCGKDGHTRDGCFKRVGYPEWWPGKNKREKGKPRAACAETESSLISSLTKEQYEEFQKHFAGENKTTQNEVPRSANMAGKYKHNDKWVVDSGCTEHITYRSDILEGITDSTNEAPVTIPNGETVPVEAKGSHTLPNGMKVQEVLHVPKFTFNLLSVSKLSKDLNCAVTFFPEFFIMQGLRSRKLIGAGRCKDGLYQMGMLGNKRKAMVVTSDMWHKRLGHAGDEKLSQINFLNNFSFKNSDDVCDSCMKSKLTRKPFPISTTKTSACFDLIHCDIWGKYRTPSFSKANYF